MRIVIISIVVLNFVFSSLVFSAPADSSNDKPAPLSTADAAKGKDDKTTTNKSAGSPEDKDNSRTFEVEYQKIIDAVKPHSSPAAVAPVPYVPIAPQPVSYGKYPPFGYGYGYGFGGSSYGAPFNYPLVPVIPAPALSHPSPVISLPAVSTAPAISAPVIPSTPVISRPVQTAPVHLLQTTFPKPVVPVNPHVVQQPLYAISKQIIHKPVITEIVEKIRRPVITEIEEVVHRPVITHLSQVIQRPLYAQHIIRPAAYSQVQQEFVKGPVILKGESVNVFDKPQSQHIQLPSQIVQPVASHVVQSPVVHQELAPTTSYPILSKPVTTGLVGFGSYPSYGIGSYGFGSGSYGSGFGIGPSYGIGSSYGVGPSYGIGPGYGLGSSYGLGPSYGLGSSYGVGSSYGSNYGIGSIAEGWYGEGQGYITPTSCRATGTCPRDAEDEDTALPPPQLFSTVMTPMNQNSQMPQSINMNSGPMRSSSPDNKNLGEKPVDNGDLSLFFREADKEKIDKILDSEEFKKGFVELWKKLDTTGTAKLTQQKKELVDFETSIHVMKEFAKKNPIEWAKLYEGIEPKMQSMDKQSSEPADQGKPKN